MDSKQEKNQIQERNALFEELQQRNKELLTINAYLENFVYVIAHDMRSPVANLKYLIDVFTTTDEEGQKQYLPLIANSINKLDKTLKGLIQIIDVKGNKLADAIEEVDINEIIAKVLDEQQEKSTVSETIIHVDNQISDKIPYIRGYLESILRNLVSNAIKYKQPNTTPEIEITVKPEQGFVLIIVQDNGIGIDLKEHDENLFFPFKRINKDIPGLGIGLHIIKTIVEKNGGKITVESKVGKGSRFTVYLKAYE